MRLPDVVYIDDNELNRHIVKKNVGTSFNMHVLSSAKELYALLENYVPRVLLLDLIMPDESGFEVLKNLRSQDRYNRLVIIMLTARSSKADMIRCFEAGANDYMLKPPHYPELIARIHNLLRQRRTEEHMRLQNQVQTYETLLNGMTHEFNNIFSAFKLSLQMYEMKGSEAFDPRITELQKFIDRGIGLVRQLRTVGYARSRNLEILDLHSVLIKAIDDFRENSDLNQIELNTMIASDQVHSILGNEVQLDQVIQNLLNNSRHAIFSRGGLGRIEVKLDLVPESNSISLTIQDDGIGIVPEKLEELGNLFYTTKGSLGGQIHDSKYSGTGIGLTTCRRILMSHEAEMDIRSEYGKGTQIKITFPISQIV
tara:strand:- start:850 stop:1956 length:1107 start_codon:yes stop_codon:yes gene_type:complete